MAELEGRELSWNDEIRRDNNDFVLLPEGDYDFVVQSFERGRHNGSPKLPPCNKAILKIRIDTDEGSALITHNLFLHTITEGMLSSFFAAIGQKKKGEKMIMNWNTVPGANGRCKVGIHDDPNDSKKKYNDIRKFYPKEESSAKKFEPGRF